MVIAVDAAGGDYFPMNPVQGAVEAVTEDESLQIILTGPKDPISRELQKYTYDSSRIEILDAPEVIGMDESPSSAVKNKQRSSIVAGLSEHKKGECQAFVSAGNTGALLAASVLILGKLRGVQRPTISAALPTVTGTSLLIDAGANLELKPNHYLQFARMGSIYSREILGVKDPGVGLINIGEEPEKGTELLKEVYRELSKESNFIGNLEGKDILTGKADVMLCDGLIGNVILKFGESIPDVIRKLLENTMKDLSLAAETKEAVIKVFRNSLTPFNYEQVGGVLFLGVNGVSMVGHGGSSPKAIKNMIRNAVHCIEAGVNDKIVAALDQTKIAD